MEKQIEEHIATIEIKKDLCDKPCDLCKMYGKECMPLRMAKKLAKQRWRKQVQGEWVKHSICGVNCDDFYRCKDCGYLALKPTRYCGNCGAKMKGN